MSIYLLFITTLCRINLFFISNLSFSLWHGAIAEQLNIQLDVSISRVRVVTLASVILVTALIISALQDLLCLPP